MLDLAEHIIDSKVGHFQPKKFEDRYEDALRDLIKRKQAGKEITSGEGREARKENELDGRPAREPSGRQSAFGFIRAKAGGWEDPSRARAPRSSRPCREAKRELKPPITRSSHQKKRR
jgi:DNA end-binding protein Ku